MDILEILKAILLGIVEGITEWLPVSSTGHMILLDEFISLKVSPSFMEMFLVVIQLGAIAAVAVLYFDKLNPLSRRKTEAEKKSTWSLWAKVIVGAIPAAVFGLLLDDLLDEYFYNYVVVSIALIVYGVVFILIESGVINKLKKRLGKKSQLEDVVKENTTPRVTDVEALSYTDAIKIGAFQVLSLIPGTSRSGSTIIGGMLSGVSRKASAEFSFFMALPIMLGASGLKVVKFILDGFSATTDELILLLIGIVISFAVSLFAIKFLISFVSSHDMKPFGIYRILLGIIVLIYFLVRSFA